MHDTIARSTPSAVDVLVSLVADADARGELVVSSSRLVDAFLDVRSAAGITVAAVDVALTACAHRSVVPVDEALELVASVTSGPAV